MCKYTLSMGVWVLPSPSLLDSGPAPNCNWFSFCQEQKTSNDSQSKRARERVSNRERDTERGERKVKEKERITGGRGCTDFTSQRAQKTEREMSGD